MARAPRPVLTTSVGGVADSIGAAFSPDSLAQVLTYGADGVATITASGNGHSWVKTFTYTAGKLTGISAWVKTA